jgi:hypothetical protein
MSGDFVSDYERGFDSLFQRPLMKRCGRLLSTKDAKSMIFSWKASS